MSAVAYDEGVGVFERRIGQRVATVPLPASVPAPDERGHRPAEPQWSGRVVDLSVTGAGLEGPDRPGLPLGASLLLTIDGRDSVVKVTRVARTDTPGTVHYGVEFSRMDPELKGRVYRTLGIGRPGEGVWIDAH
jgi:hypothetical protein